MALLRGRLLAGALFVGVLLSGQAEIVELPIAQQAKVSLGGGGGGIRNSGEIVYNEQEILLLKNKSKCFKIAKQDDDVILEMLITTVTQGILT